MGKKKQLLVTTGIQKILSMMTLISALIYLFYRSAMSVLNKVIVYEGLWVTLYEVVFWMTIGTGLLYVGYLTVCHPMKRVVRHNFKEMVFSFDYILLLILLLLMYISVASIKGLVPTSDWWGVNRSTLVDTTGQILVLFPLGCWLARHRDAREFRVPLHVFTIGFLALEIFVLIRTFTNNVIMLANGGGIGIDGNLSLVINCNRNTTGLWGYCFLFLCLYLAVTAKKWLKPVYIVGILVNLIIIALSMSRASSYAGCLMLGLFAAIWFWYQKRICTGNSKVKIFCSILFGIVTTIGFYFLNDLLYKLYLKISNIEALLGVEATGRELFDESMSDRARVYIASLKALVYDVRSFFFGVSPIGIYSRINELANRNLYTHNQILEFGVGCGVPAMIIFIVFCVRLFLHSVKVCFQSGNRCMRNTLASLGCFLLLLGNMFEATLFGFNYISGMIFVVACGFLTELNRKLSLLKDQNQ